MVASVPHVATVNIAREEAAVPSPRLVFAGGLLLGLCGGLLGALALRGGLVWALLVVAALTLTFLQPWSARARRLDRHHQSLVAARPLS